MLQRERLVHFDFDYTTTYVFEGFWTTPLIAVVFHKVLSYRNVNFRYKTCFVYFNIS